MVAAVHKHAPIDCGDLAARSRDRHPVRHSATMIKKLIELWTERAMFFNALNSTPQTLCHRDVFPRNAFVRPTPSGEQTVLVDWAFVGPGPVGAELTPLVEASMTWFECGPEQAETTCLEGYLEGLQTAGWAGSREDVEFGYLASLVLRSGLGAFTPIVTIARDPDLHDWIAGASAAQPTRSFATYVPPWPSSSAALTKRNDCSPPDSTQPTSTNGSHSDEQIVLHEAHTHVISRPLSRARSTTK
jgi:hypothetical protein